MPTTRCSCGKLIVIPAGKPAPAACPGCKAPLKSAPAGPVGATAVRPRRTVVRRKSRVGAWIAAGIGVAFICVVALGLVGTFLLKPTDKYEASSRESASDRAEAVREAFAYKAETIDETKDRVAIEKVLAELVAANGRNDAEGFTRQFHVHRLLAELRAIPGFPRIRTRIDENQALAGIRQGLGSMATSGPVEWKSIKVLKVRHASGRPEADAFARVTTSDAATIKVRFRLIKEDGAWLVFDWELIEEAVLVSTLIAQGAGMARDPAGLARVQSGTRAYHDVVGLLKSGKLAEAERAAAQSKGLDLPDHLRASFSFFQGVAVAGQGRVGESLALYDEALARKPEFYAALLLKSSALCNLERFPEAAALATKYLDYVGDDEQAWANLAVCRFRLGELPAAEEAALNSLRIDPATDDAWTALEAVYEQAGRPPELASVKARRLPAPVLQKSAPGPAPSASPSPPGQDEEQIVKVVTRLILSSEKRDASGFAAEIDIDRLIDTASRCSGAPPMDAAIRRKLAALFRDRYVATYLTRPERWLVPFPMSCRITEPGREAVLLAVIHQPEPKRALVRFRLAKGPAGWKVYDWEEPSMWLRLSRMIGLLYPDAGIEPVAAARWRDGVAACMSAAEAFVQLPPDQAMSEYQRTVTSNIPDCFKAVLDLLAAEVLIRNSKWREAEELARKGMGRHPDAAWGRRLVARAQFEAGNLAGAIPTWKSVFDLQMGEDPWIHAWLAEAYLKSKLPTKAEEHSMIAVKMYPQLDKAWELLIKALEANGRQADADFVRKNGKLPPGR